MTIRIFVSVGTDHHRFDRLIDWIDDWAQDRSDVELIVQHGASRPSRTGTNSELMAQAELAGHYSNADIVVAQVGPGTISDANRSGLRPVVVPRDPHLDEVVDDHQFAFGSFMAEQQRCWTVTDEQSFRERLDTLCDDPTRRRIAAHGAVSSAPDNVDRLVTGILARPSRRGYSLRGALTVGRATPRI